MKWEHHHDDEPIEIYSEIDQSCWEIRKVELFYDGTTSYASPFHHTGSTWLAEAPIPDLAEINANSEFEGEWMNRHDFERVWLMSSEMITLHEPTLVQNIQRASEQKDINVNEFVAEAVQQYLQLN